MIADRNVHVPNVRALSGFTGEAFAAAYAVELRGSLVAEGEGSPL
jgi:hypothetical protein